LALALVGGPTLAQFATNRLPIDEAISIGRQIIAALEYAHERGVIHRDLKPYLNGAGWNSDGVIVAGATNAGSPIMRVSASGGQATPITALALGETAHTWPQLLPDGKHFLYERVSADPAKAGVYVGSIGKFYSRARDSS